jgi:hypothetical protein
VEVYHVSVLSGTLELLATHDALVAAEHQFAAGRAKAAPAASAPAGGVNP